MEKARSGCRWSFTEIGVRHRVAGLECLHPPCHLAGVLFGAFQASSILEAKLFLCQESYRWEESWRFQVTTRKKDGESTYLLHRTVGGKTWVAIVLCHQSLGSFHCRCYLIMLKNRTAILLLPFGFVKKPCKYEEGLKQMIHILHVVSPWLSDKCWSCLLIA